MRLEKLIRTGFLIVAGLLFINCSSDNDSAENNTQKNDIENNLKSGSWMITEYIDDGVDEAYHYDGYEFTFEAGGALTATNGVNSYTGTWSISSDSDDDSQSDYDFVIFFSGPANFEELSDDWDMMTHNANTIDLYDVSGGDGTTDYLTFKRL